MAAVAITRGNITIRDHDDYLVMNLGDWNDDQSGEKKEALKSIINCTDAVADRICYSYPVMTRSKHKTNLESASESDDNVADNDGDIDSDTVVDTVVNPDANENDDEPVADECRTDIVNDWYKDYDAAFSGMKDSLDSKHRKMKSLQLHMQSGCI